MRRKRENIYIALQKHPPIPRISAKAPHNTQCVLRCGKSTYASNSRRYQLERITSTDPLPSPPFIKKPLIKPKLNFLTQKKLLKIYFVLLYTAVEQASKNSRIHHKKY